MKMAKTKDLYSFGDNIYKTHFIYIPIENSGNAEMIATEKLEELMKCIFWTGWLKNESPVSCLISGKISMGKTELVSNFKENKGILYINDATAFGVAKL